MDMYKFKVRGVLLEGNFLGRWYICINPLKKRPENILSISTKAPSSYLAHYDMILEEFPDTWFTILVREFKAAMEPKMKSVGQIHSILYFNSIWTSIQFHEPLL